MDYEKAYKESFEAAKGLHEAGNALTKMQMEIVFPQLAESEDERIRKWIANYIHRGVFDEEEHPKALKAVEWLEKQKEQKPIQTDVEREYVRTLKSLISDFIRGKEEVDREYYQQIFDRFDGRHIEQKPAQHLPEEKVFDIMRSLTALSYSERIPINSDEYGWIHKITEDVRSLLDYPIEQKAAEWVELQSEFKNINEAFEDGKKEVVAHPEKYDLCKPAEWSDEEKDKLNSIERLIVNANAHGNGLIGDKEAIELQHFIRSIVKPTTNLVEWSEEDEDMLNSCISSIEEAKENRYAYKETDGDTSYDHEIAWLKSLRNRVGKEFLQPHWKPSEEQMNGLAHAINLDVYDAERYGLDSLYNDLKKLM